MLKSIGATILLIALSAQTSSQKCYGLAMEGGGMKGAYEAGALMAMTELIPPEETTYSIITGISIGAINGCIGVGYPVGQERQMAEHIHEFWTSFSGPEEFITNYFGGTFFAQFFHNSLYNNANELVTIRKWAGDTIRRNLTVAATNYNTGKFTSFSQDLGMETLTRGCYASSAYPPVLTPVEVMGEWYADGAVTSNLDGFDAIKKCRELGYDDKDIVVDYLFDETTAQPKARRVSNTLEVIHRLRTVSSWSSGYWYVNQNLNEFPEVELRYVIIPSVETKGFMDTKKEDVLFDIQLGYNDATNLITKSKSERLQHVFAQLGTFEGYL